MSAQQQGESGNRLRSVWAVLNRPLFGTQPRAEQVWIEGRLNKFQIVAVLLLVVAPITIALAVGAKLGIKALGAAATSDWLCEPGLGGYSLGREIVIAMLMSPPLLYIPFLLYTLSVGRRIRRQQRTIPLEARPWFPKRLLEGRAAVRFGTRQMMISVVMLSLLFGVSIWGWITFSEMFLAPPAEIAKCQPPHSPKSASSESLAPIPQEI